MHDGRIPVSPTLEQRGWWFAYAGLILAVGLLLGLAELQHYSASGGRRVWEPFLWELSSVATTGMLAPLIYRLHVRALVARQLWRHLLGAPAYVLAHVGGMFGIRFAVYALAGLSYDPGGATDVLGYEAGKDLVSYMLIVAVCHGLSRARLAQRREQELERVQRELAEARLARLASQLQPHFLFNSLNLISSVMYEDVPRADRLLCELAALLRQTLVAQQVQQHTLGEELALVAPYLSLMQARFGERLQVSVSADEDARRCGVPPLLLISPVENAIQHGVAVSAGAVQLDVRAWVDADVLHLAVDNTGPEPQRIEREGGVGLDNLRQRLTALHGERSRVTLGSRDGGGTRLEIELPALPLARAAPARAPAPADSKHPAVGDLP